MCVTVSHVPLNANGSFSSHFTNDATLKRRNYLSFYHCYANTKQNSQHSNKGVLLFLYSCAIQFFCLKIIESGCFFVLITPSNSLFKVGTNTLIQTLFMILLNGIVPARRNILVSYTLRDWHTIVFKLFDNRSWNYVVHNNRRNG